MDKLAVLACVLLLAGAATAAPGSTWRRASEDESSPDRDVEVVQPVRGGGSRGGAAGRGVVAVPRDDDSDESAEVPFGIGINLGGLGGLGGFGPVRPVIVRTLGQPGGRHPTEDSDEDLPGGYVSTGYLHPYFVDPMSNFMAQMAEMMAAMRRQMSQVLNRGGAGDADADGPDFSKLGNTTSTTKVVDGHVVTVNETVIGGGDGDAVLHVRVIDIHPSESPADADAGADEAPAATPSSGEDADKNQDRDVEPLESSNEVTSGKPRRDNEIPMKPLKRSVRSTRRRAAPAPARGDIASTGSDDDDDDVQQYQMPVFEPDTQQSQVPVFDVQQQQVPVFDLQQQQVPVFDLQQQQQQQRMQQVQQSGQLRLLPAGTTNNNQVDAFDKPRQQGDLSRDTLVNVILERQHQRGGLIMVDPDAELMDVRDGKVVRAYSPGRPSRPGRQAPRNASPSPSWTSSSWSR